MGSTFGMNTEGGMDAGNKIKVDDIHESTEDDANAITRGTITLENIPGAMSLELNDVRRRSESEGSTTCIDLGHVYDDVRTDGGDLCYDQSSQI